ncbi:MAG: cytochrome P460 family protein [Myxococcales bacterium]|nr:cytochrome P460 family protein [Myxococcales bacterium]
MLVRWSLLALCSAALAAPAAPAYPEGYRSWAHVKSLQLGEGHPLAATFGGLHHVYVNDTGESALRAGRALPDGSVLVFDLLEVQSEGGAVSEGPRKFTAVMVKDAKRWASTGGWGFDAFAGDGRERVVTDGGVSCFSCHASQQSTDYVFSRWRN